MSSRTSAEQSPSGFGIHHTHVMPGVSLVGLRGEVSYRNAPELRRGLIEQISDRNEERVVIELGSVDAMDTAGAAVLVETLQVGRAQGKSVLFCAASDAVLRTFKMAGLEEALRCCYSDEKQVRRKLEETTRTP